MTDNIEPTGDEAQATSAATTHPPADPPASQLTPHQQFLEMLPEDLREDPSFIDFKGESVNDIVAKLGKSYHNTKKLVGADKNAILKIPSSEEDVDGWNAIYEKLGRPESADKYDLAEIIEGNDFIDKDGLKEILELAHSKGASNDLMKAIVGKFVEQTSKAGAVSQEQLEGIIKEYDATLDKEWGQAKEQKLQKIQANIKKFADDEIRKDVLENPIIFEKPNWAKFFDNVFKGNAEDAGLEAGGTTAEAAMTPAEAKAELSKMDGDPSIRQIMLNSGDPRREDLMAKRNKLFKYAYGS